MAIYMYDAENVEFKFSQLRRHLKRNIWPEIFVTVTLVY